LYLSPKSNRKLASRFCKAEPNCLLILSPKKVIGNLLHAFVKQSQIVFLIMSQNINRKHASRLCEAEKNSFLILSPKNLTGHLPNDAFVKQSHINLGFFNMLKFSQKIGKICAASFECKKIIQ
jgi:hypothetical protein